MTNIETNNKNNLYIYGDSFGKFNLNQPNPFSWIDVVVKELDISNVINFAVPGNSVLHVHEDYTLNKNKEGYHIFIVPSFHRFRSRIIESDFAFVKEFNSNIWYTNPEGCDFVETFILKRATDFLRNLPDIEIKRLINIVQGVKFFLTTLDDLDSRVLLYQSLLEKTIAEANIKTLFISTDERLNDKTSLTNVCVWELNMLGWEEKVHPHRLGSIVKGKCLQDKRFNHFSQENNIILGEKIVQALKSQVKILDLDVKDFVIPNKDIWHYIAWESIGQ